jgi:hypothetical protein
MECKNAEHIPESGKVQGAKKVIRSRFVRVILAQGPC